MAQPRRPWRDEGCWVGCHGNGCPRDRRIALLGGGVVGGVGGGIVEEGVEV